MEIQILTASESDKSLLVKTIVRAFITDPMTRWCWPDLRVYLEAMPSFIEAYAGGAFRSNSAYCTNDRKGAAMWLTPGDAPDEERMAQIAEKSVSPTLLAEVFGVMEKMAVFHPKEPHWHLPLIGVEPAQQGKGYGSALLAHTLKLCDSQGFLAYLESSNPANIPLYERHGFRVIGEIQSGTSPTMLAMLREC